MVFPPDFLSQLVSSSNHSGNVTIADLQLLANAIQKQEGYTTLVGTRGYPWVPVGTHEHLPLTHVPTTPTL
jgi:hypothetical protein